MDALTKKGSKKGAFVIRGGTLLTMDRSLGVLDGHELLVEDGRIAQIAPRVAATETEVEVFDATAMIVMPGFVDTHLHLWSSLGRNFLKDGFGTNMYRHAKRATAPYYEPADFYLSARLGLIQCASAGITTVNNWSHNVRSLEHARAEIAAHVASNVRARYSYGYPDLLPEDRLLDFDGLDDIASDWPGGRRVDADLLRLGVCLRGPDEGSPDLFDIEMSLCQERELPVSIHTQQGESTNVNPSELEDKGLLGRNLLIAHFLAARHLDRAAMARSGSPLSWSPHSELRLGTSGDPRVALFGFRDDGVVVSLSNDAASIAQFDMFESMRLVWNLGIPWRGTSTEETEPISFDYCLRMATLNGAFALGMDDITGSLTPGKRADIIMIRTGDLNIAPPGNVQSTVVRSATPQNVDTVIIDGEIVKRGGIMVQEDVGDIIEQAQQAAYLLRRRVQLTL